MPASSIQARHALALAATAWLASCASAVECPPGHQREGQRCRSLERELDAAPWPMADRDVADLGHDHEDAPSFRDANAPRTRDTPQRLPYAPELLDASARVDSSREQHALPPSTLTDAALSDGCRSVDQGHAEQCNAVDDNCNGVADEDFSCVAMADVSCNTRCGSTGTGTCTNACELPVGDACKPPEELCNYRDDDCDGLIDPELIASLPGSARVYTQPLAAPPDAWTSTDTALLPRPGGGAWWLYRHTGEGQWGPIYVAGLDAQGRPTTESPDDSRLQSTTHFVAAADANWIAIASQHLSASSTQELRVQLFRAADMRFVSESVLASLANTKCGLLSPFHIAVKEADTAVYVAVAYADPGMPDETGTCAPWDFRLALQTRLGQTWGTWRQHALPSDQGNVALLSSPCRAEWLVTAGAELIRYTQDPGELIAPTGVALPPAIARDLAATPCSQASTSQIGVGYIATNGRPHLLQLSAATTGRLMPGDDREFAGEQTLALELGHAGGRWFMAHYQVANHQLALLEIARPDVDARSLWSLNDSAADVTPGAPLGAATGRSVLTLADVGQALVLGSSVGAQGNLDAARPSGITDPSVAVTYNFGCALAPQP